MPPEHSSKGQIARIKAPLALILAIRIGLVLVMYAGLLLIPLRADMPWQAFPDNLLIDGLVRWDSAWYRDIAERGYTNIPQHAEGQRDTAFFPLYPMLIWLVRQLVGDTYIAGLIVANVAAIAALLVLYLLVEARYGAQVASSSVMLIGVYPFSFFLSVVYSESVFLLAVALAFYCGERRRWLLAGLFAAAAGATRVVGSLVIVALVLLYLEQIQFSRRRIRADILWLALGLLGIGGYMLFLALRFGDPLQFVASQYVSGWGAGVTIDAAIRVFQGLSFEAIRTGAFPAMELIHLLLFCGGLILLLVGWRQIPLSYSVWSLLMLLASFALWRSMGRLMLVIFPLFLILALFLAKSRRIWPVIYLFSLFLALFAVMFAHFYWVA
jgi:Dolichyl-phosphate-mannose-protein mannosyltransferase